MKIERIETLVGPNVYTHQPALVMQLDLENLAERESRNFEFFNENLLKLIPGLYQHTCNLDYENGFVERLKDGASFGYIIEHVVIELSHLVCADIAVDYGKTYQIFGKSNLCNVIVEYKAERAMRFLLETAVQIVEKLLTDQPFAEIEIFKNQKLEQARKIVYDCEPDSSVRSIVDAARKRNIPFNLLCDNALMQLGYGNNRRFVQTGLNNSDVCEVNLVLCGSVNQISVGAGDVIKLNAIPEFRMRSDSGEEQVHTIGEAVIEMLYPNNAESRIPIISVTGTNGKTTVTRMVAHAFAQIQKIVGLTTTDGVWIGDELVASGDITQFVSANIVLSNSNVEVAALETASGSILKRGLGYDWSDVSIITNVQPDHIGQDGIETIEDILRVKLLVAERVCENGTLVLNADDELLMRLANEPGIAKIKKNIVYFSLKPNHITIKRHLSAGGTAYILRDNVLIEATSRGETPIVEANKIPIALDGYAEFNVANALAAAAACRAQNLTVEQVADALCTFEAERHNRGRANLFEVDGAYVFLDYAHNPDAFRSICKLITVWNDGMRRITGIIAAPDCNNNSLIKDTGRAVAGTFHRLILREDKNFCERSSGEVAQLLYQAVKNEAPALDCHIILDESEAFRREITRLQKGDILVCFYKDFALVRSILKRCDAKAVSRIDTVSSNSRFGLRHA